MEKIQVKNLDHLFNSHCEGHRPKKKLVFNGKFQENNRFGKNREFAISSTDGKSGILHNHKTAKSINWFLKDIDFKNSTSKKPKAIKKEFKDVSKEFEKFALVKTHPYSEAKKVSISDLGFRTSKGNLLIPFYTLHGHFMSGWQVIWSQADNKGKWPKTTRPGSSNKDIYLKIGKETDEINISEGPSTSLSIYFISNRQTYCTFGKNNLIAVTEYLLNSTNKIINLYLDNDKDQYIPALKHKRLRIFRPDKNGDFNDFQDDKKERDKIINCHPVYKPKKELPKDAQALKQKLDNLGYEVRLNTRKDRIELKGFNSESWNELTDEEHSLLFLECKAESSLKKTNYEDQLKAVASAKQVDPFQEYLEGLVWDGKERLKEFLFSAFNVDDEHKDLAEWAFKAIMLATVRRTFEPGAKHDEFVVLQGAQGIGKSSFLYHLFEDKNLFSNTVSFSDQYPRIVENILDKAIVEVAELSGFKKADLEKMKNVITTQKDTVRLAYRRNARDYLRKCIFVGTTNDSTPLPDDLTGLRRFVLISLKTKITVSGIKELIKDNRNQLWAEAVTLYKKNKSARLPQTLWKKSAEVAEDHRGGDHSFEYAFCNAIKNKVDVNIPEVLKELKDGKQLSFGDKPKGGGWIRDITPKLQSKAAEILRKNGYKKHRKRVENSKNPITIWFKYEKICTF